MYRRHKRATCVEEQVLLRAARKDTQDTVPKSGMHESFLRGSEKNEWSFTPQLSHLASSLWPDLGICSLAPAGANEGAVKLALLFVYVPPERHRLPPFGVVPPQK